MNRSLWQPTADAAAATQIAGLARARGFAGADAIELLRRWSVDQPAAFWQAVWELGGVKASRSADRVLTDADKMPGARWFEGARLNFAENLLRRDDASPALLFTGEDGRRRELSWALLQSEVRSLAAALAADGVGIGDRVAGYLPNLPETIIAMLATTALGAVWSSASPDFGVEGVLDRFGQIEPKVLFAVDGYPYAGKRLDIRAKVAAVAAGIPGLKRTVLVPFLDPAADPGPVAGAVLYADYKWEKPTRRSPSRSCPSTTRSTFSTLPARPGSRRRSCTAPAARCCSTSRNTGCIAMRARAIASSISRPAAG